MEYKVTHTSWKQNHIELSEIRRKVFIEEQHVPEDLEWDELDETSHHILALDNNDNPIGCGRIKSDGQIGRMAVLKSWRNKGIGNAILIKLIEHAIKSKLNEIYLHSQTSAIGFYEKHGFIINSDEFMDAGIPHKTMTLKVKENEPI